jgi:hypothetical protein
MLLLHNLFEVFASRATLRADLRRFRAFVNIVTDDATPFFHALLLWG